MRRRTDFEQRLGYKFRHADLLDEVLTHSSASAAVNNERLAFLGDAVIELAIRHDLFRRHGTFGKGLLTDEKKKVVPNERLAGLARHLNLPPPRLGPSMKVEGANDTGMAQLYEAAIGAVFEEAGFKRAAKLVLLHWQRSSDVERQSTGTPATPRGAA